MKWKPNAARIEREPPRRDVPPDVMTREEWQARCWNDPAAWPWEETALPRALFEGRPEDRMEALPAAGRPRLRGESEEQFRERLNRFLTEQGYGPLAIIDSGKNGKRVVAMMLPTLQPRSVQLNFWLRVNARMAFERFAVRTHYESAKHSPCVVLVLLEHGGEAYQLLAQENRFPLFFDEEWSSGVKENGRARNAWAKAAPRAFAGSNAMSSFRGVRVPVIPLRASQTVTPDMTKDVLAVLGRKAGAVTVPQALSDGSTRRVFEFRDVVLIDRTAEDSGADATVVPIYVARLRYVGPEAEFDRFIQERYGTFDLSATFHSLDAFVGEEGVEECARVGVCDNHTKSALYSFMCSRQRLAKLWAERDGQGSNNSTGGV